MVAILKIYFSLLVLNQKANWLETWLEASGWLADQKQIKSFRSENQDGHSCSHLENLFFASCPEPKGHLTWNLVGSTGMTCRSKIAKLFGSKIQDGHRGHLENLFFTSSPEPKGHLTWTWLEASGWLIDQKQLKSFQSEIQDGCHGQLPWIFFTSAPEPKGQLTWNLVGSIGVMFWLEI